MRPALSRGIRSEAACWFQAGEPAVNGMNDRPRITIPLSRRRLDVVGRNRSACRIGVSRDHVMTMRTSGKRPMIESVAIRERVSSEATTGASSIALLRAKRIAVESNSDPVVTRNWCPRVSTNARTPTRREDATNSMRTERSDLPRRWNRPLPTSAMESANRRSGRKTKIHSMPSGL